MSEATFFTATYVEVILPFAAEGAELLREFGEASRRDDGAVRFDVLGRMERRNHFVLLAAWEDQEAFEAHSATEPFVRLARELAPMLAAPTDTRQHRGLSLGDGKELPSANAITAVTHVDVVPQFKDDGAAALQQLAEDSRAHSGHLRFEVWQQTSRPNHFTIVEAWSALRSFTAHASAAQTRDFRTKLASMTGALYDERWYRTLDRFRR